VEEILWTDRECCTMPGYFAPSDGNKSRGMPWRNPEDTSTSPRCPRRVIKSWLLLHLANAHIGQVQQRVSCRQTPAVSPSAWAAKAAPPVIPQASSSDGVPKFVREHMPECCTGWKPGPGSGARKTHKTPTTFCHGRR
jgi:hypothetical protein